MIYLPRSSNYYFIVFLVIGFSALAVIPSLSRAFKQTSDQYIIAEMNRAQAEMYFYKLEHKNFKRACMHANFISLGYEVLAELGAGLSCTTDSLYKNMSLFTELSSHKIYCVDSSGVQRYISLQRKPMGYCSKS